MDFFLDFEICKAVSGEEHNGNYVFQVEASNENIDFQDQVVLQEALLKSKDNFLKNGVISYDHLHRRKDENGNMVSDPSMIIGEPIDVWTEGGKTFVKGVLYKTNEKAMEVVKLLKAGSTRIRASVGGLFPKVEKGTDGVEKVVSVLWNDLALTPCPVNNTVGAASFAKSFTPESFAKALTAGAETDSAAKVGGAALIAEDIGKGNEKDVPQDDDDLGDDQQEEILKSLLGLIEQGKIRNKTDIYDYFVSKGIEKEESWAAAHEIDKSMGGCSMAKRTGAFLDEVKTLFKSMGSENTGDMGKDDDGDDIKVTLDGTAEGDDGDGGENDDDDDGENDDDDEMKKGKTCKKSFDYYDATNLIKSLSEELAGVRKENAEMKKSISELGDCMIEIAKAVSKNASMVKSLGDEPMGPRAKMEKSVKGSVGVKGELTQADLKWAQDVLVKSVKEGEISIEKSAMIERDIQLAMAMTGHQMKSEHYNFLAKKYEGGN